jgi:hypothetical protein
MIKKLYKKNEMLTVFLTTYIVLLIFFFFFKITQYVNANIYDGKVIGKKQFRVEKYSRHSNKYYKTYVFPPKIEFTDKTGEVRNYSQIGWEEAIPFELDEKIKVLVTKNDEVYIYSLFTFWLEIEKVIKLLGASIILTVFIEIVIHFINFGK